MTLKLRITIMGAAGIILSAVTLSAVGLWVTSRFSQSAQHETSHLIEADWVHTNEGFVGNIQAQDETISSIVQSALKTTAGLIKDQGGIHFSGEKTSWEAVNQIDKSKVTVALPKAFVGSTWLGQTKTFDKGVDIVDRVTAETSCATTIFQKMNSKGDMLRVATSVANKEGKRAIGTYIPALKPDQTANPVIAKILKKESYSGTAFVVDAWYIVRYDPVVDAKGDVVGMIFCGAKQESAPSLRNSFNMAKIGERGTVLSIGGTGEKKGQVFISKEKQYDGQNLTEGDTDLSKAFKQVVETAPTLKEGEKKSLEFTEKQDGEIVKKTVTYSYYKPWDWIVAVIADPP